MHPFSTPWKHQKTCFEGGTERVHWEQIKMKTKLRWKLKIPAFSSAKTVTIFKHFPFMKYFFPEIS